MPTAPYDPARDGAQMNYARDMSYGDYLQLGSVLGAQEPQSAAHDEMLFIIQHQTSELWMKLALHELAATRAALVRKDLQPAFKMLTRVARIFEQLNAAWDVLRTMTPSEYTEFRDSLGPSSGFQSHQYRLIEFMLGNRNPNMLRPHEHRPDIVAQLQAELEQPSLYDQVIALLCAAFEAPCPAPQLGTPHAVLPDVQALWQRVYDDPAAHWDLYQMGEKLVDIEDYFRRWRFNHVTTVERVIGFKRGTGGTSGVSYLRKMLEVELFPELWSVRGDL